MTPPAHRKWRDLARQPTVSSVGRIVTFYSYKGGTGRTMALANVAWILAANGKRVLVADWDLESPGLHRFFLPFLDKAAVATTGGVIDLLRHYEWAATQPEQRAEGWEREYASVARFTVPLRWAFPGQGCLDLLGAGLHDLDYEAGVNDMDWAAFYDQLGGGRLLEALRDTMRQSYDYTLIDSRAGFSDVADICTAALPDLLVDCFTYSDQGILGAARLARRVNERFAAREIRILPVPMRVDSAEKQKAEIGRSVAMRHFAGYPTGMSEQERQAYWAAVAVPYQSFYGYEETLATFGDPPGSPRTLLHAYEMLTRYLTDGEVVALPPMEEALRARVNERFLRRPVAGEQIVLRYAPADRAWAEWIEELLRGAGMRVAENGAGRELMVVSAASAGRGEVPPPALDTAPPMAVYVADVRPVPGFDSSCSTFIAGLDMQSAAERILDLVGCDAPGHPGGARFPGQEPAVFGVPARNARFTGRESALLALRETLRGNATVVLHGMGGVGKTQLAVEYAHRYRGAYDIVWWVTSDPATFIDTIIADLGQRLDIPSQPTVLETARATLQMLERGEAHRRWLLIFDNAEELERLGPFLPQGRGHVLITSRNHAWADRAHFVEVDVFRRFESTAHLVQRVPTIGAGEADQIAERLGDLPIALAAAGAWLAETGADTASYLQLLEEHGDTSVDQAFHLALRRLRERSPAAFGLLQICSVLAPEIDLRLVYSDEMATALSGFDPSVTDRLACPGLVQQINRLALLRLDAHRGQIHVHRVLQRVVRALMSAGELAEIRHRGHLVLAASRPHSEVDDPQAWPGFRMLWPHLEVSEAVSCTDASVRQLLIDRVRYLGQRGDLPEGRRLAERIDAVWQGQLDGTPSSPTREPLLRQLLHLRFNHANILRDLALFEQSREMDEAVLRAQRDLLGPSHPHALMTSGGLAADLRALGRYPEALKLDQATHAQWSEAVGDDHPRTLTALNNLASSYRHMGDFHAALDCDQRVLQGRRLVLGETHPNTLASASNLGRDIREAGGYEDSVARLRSVSQTLLRLWGNDFRITLNAQANLAISLRMAGRAAQAEPLLENAYERLNETLGPKAPDTLACRHSRAVNLLALNQVESAIGELEAVRRAYEESLGTTHPHTLLCVNNLAAAARALHPAQTAHARELAQTAAQRLRSSLGPLHPYTLAARANLAVCAAEAGALEIALRDAEQVADHLAATIGADHPDTLRCEGNLAILSRRLNLPGAEEKVAAARKKLEDRLGADHPATSALRGGRLLHRVVEPHPF